jgi:hypothetical protein
VPESGSAKTPENTITFFIMRPGLLDFYSFDNFYDFERCAFSADDHVRAPGGQPPRR